MRLYEILSNEIKTQVQWTKNIGRVARMTDVSHTYWARCSEPSVCDTFNIVTVDILTVDILTCHRARYDKQHACAYLQLFLG